LVDTIKSTLFSARKAESRFTEGPNQYLRASGIKKLPLIHTDKACNQARFCFFWTILLASFFSFFIPSNFL